MPAVVVDFQIAGTRRVLEAFSTVAKASLAAEKQVARTVQNETRARERGAKSATAIADRKFKELERSLTKEQKAAERTEAAKTKARERAEQAAIREDGRRFNAIVRRLDREVLEEDRAARSRERIRERQEKNATRIAERAAKERDEVRKRFGGSVASMVMGSARGALSATASVAGGILALGGGFSAADAVQSSVRNRGKAADLAIQAGGSVSRDQILAKASSVGTSYGTSTEEVIGGLDAFVAKSGDVKAGFEAIQSLVELATATGADLGELSRTAGIVQMTTGNAKDTMGVMREMAGMGRAGSVDMRELSQYAGRITAGASQFGDKRAAITQLGAFVQQAAATGGATAAPEATEAVARFATDVFEKEDAFKAAKVKTRDASGKFLRAPMDIVKDAIVNTGGDSGKLLNMFGKMSYRSVAGYQDIYNRASQVVTASGGSRADARTAGVKAMDEAFAKFADAALKEQQVKEEAARRITEVDKQLEMSLNQLREAVGTQLVPEMVKLIPQIRALIPAFADMLSKAVAFAEWFAKNPFSGLGALVLYKVGQDLAAAGIGAAVRSAVVALIGGGTAASAAGAGVGAAGAGAGALGAGGAASGLGATVTGAGFAAAAGAVAIGAAVGAGTGAIISEQTNSAIAGYRSEAGTTLNQNVELENAVRSDNGLNEKNVKRGRTFAAKMAENIQTAKHNKAKSEALANAIFAPAAFLTGQGQDFQDAKNVSLGAQDRDIKIAEERLKAFNLALDNAAKLLAEHSGAAGKVPQPSATSPTQTTPLMSPVRGGPT